MKSAFLILVAAIPLAAQVSYDRIRQADSEPGNWLTYSGGYNAQRYSRLDQINATMSNHGFIVRLTDESKQWILAKTCADRSYGARPLRRALQKHVEDPLSEALIQGHLGEASLVEMFVDGDVLSFRPIMIDEAGVEQPGDLLLTY